MSGSIVVCVWPVATDTMANIYRFSRLFMKTFKIAVLLFFLSAALTCVQATAGKNGSGASEKLSIETLKADLGLTENQVISLQNLFNVFYQKKIRLLKEMQDLEPPAAFEKQQAMQKEFYNRLGKILSAGQVDKYKKVMGIKKAGTEITIDEKSDSNDSSSIPSVKRSKVFPSLLALKNLLFDIELSGLQREAIEEFFAEIEKQASQMQYWDPSFDPADDPSFATLIQSKLLWVLTESQYREFALLARQKDENPGEVPSAPDFNDDTPDN